MFYIWVSLDHHRAGGCEACCQCNFYYVPFISPPLVCTVQKHIYQVELTWLRSFEILKGRQMACCLQKGEGGLEFIQKKRNPINYRCIRHCVKLPHCQAKACNLLNLILISFSPTTIRFSSLKMHLNHIYLLNNSLSSTNLQFESVCFNGDNLENRQFLNQLLRFLFDQTAVCCVPASALQVQTMHKAAWNNQWDISLYTIAPSR